MLDFYGIELVDEQTGKLARSQNWKSRYQNLNSSGHNNLRISRLLLVKCNELGRIIASLGELGFKRYKRPLVEHFQTEISKNEVLSKCKRSLEDFWARLLDENSAWYIKKTGETAEDRRDSVFFKDRA